MRHFFRTIMFAVCLVGASSVAAAHPLDKLVASTVRAHYRSLHRCFRFSLVEDRNRGGNLVLRLTFGHSGRVHAVKVEKDELKKSRVASCVTRKVSAWVFKGADKLGATAGVDMLLPIAFRAAKDQFLVNLADVPLQDGVRRLLTAQNAGARQVTLEMVTRARRSKPLDGDAFVVGLMGRLRLHCWQPHQKAGTRKSHFVQWGRTLWIPKGHRCVMRGKALAIIAKRPSGPHPIARWVRPFRHRGGKRADGLTRAAPKSSSMFGAAVVVLKKRQLSVKQRTHDLAVLLRSGSAELRIGKRRLSVEGGHALYVPASAPFVLRSTTTTPVEILLLAAKQGPQNAFFRTIRLLR
jgi:mannose-6-phosphate isomerase-like protein (cupin superfamily)